MKLKSINAREYPPIGSLRKPAESLSFLIQPVSACGKYVAKNLSGMDGESGTRRIECWCSGVCAIENPSFDVW